MTKPAIYAGWPLNKKASTNAFTREREKGPFGYVKKSLQAPTQS